MAEVFEVKKREQVGSAATRRLLREGHVPAVLYGHGENNEHLSIPAIQVQTVVRRHGKTVIVDHGNGKSTLYAHMSRYAPGKGKGKRVEQGQVIGYLGSSGLATGPHLHYEFRVDGVHRDPLRVKLPGAEPLDKKYRDDFNAKAESLVAQLELVRGVQVASNN